MQIDCEVHYGEEEGDYGPVPAVDVICGRCGHRTTEPVNNSETLGAGN